MKKSKSATPSTTHLLFATQVYQQSIPFRLNSLLEDIEKIRAADVAGFAWSKKNYPNGYTSYASLDQLHRMSSTFERLAKKIDAHVKHFAHLLDYQLSKKQKLQMDSCWVNVMESGAIHTSHIHPQSIISGTFYVQVPSNSSSIKFEDPRLGFFMGTPALKLSPKKFNQRFFNVQPKEGDIILFESWLRHEVPLNQSNQKRISVSFNYS